MAVLSCSHATGTRSLPSLRWQNQSPIRCRMREQSLTAKFAPWIDVADHTSKICCFAVENPPCFFAFDLLTCDGKDLRTERLLDRKQELRRLLVRSPVTSPCLRIGLGGHRCQAEICTLRHGAGAQYVVQNSESGIFPDAGS